MADLIHTHSTRVSGPGGAVYEARIYGEPERGGIWKGWLEFRRVDDRAETDGQRVLRTDTETTQPNRRALDYWAGGIEPVYLEGAIVRARSRAD